MDDRDKRCRNVGDLVIERFVIIAIALSLFVIPAVIFVATVIAAVTFGD